MYNKNVSCIHTLFFIRKFWCGKTELDHDFYIIHLEIDQFNKYLNYSIFHALSKVPALLDFTDTGDNRDNRDNT